MISVQCINERKGYPVPVKGKIYLLDSLSVTIDTNGVSYADIYMFDGSWLGRYRLSHFTSQV